MKINPEHLSPCGLYCGVCGVYYATRDNNQKFMNRLLDMYKTSITGLDDLTTDDLLCDGCLSSKNSIFCSGCSIKACKQKKDIRDATNADIFPVNLSRIFRYPSAKKSFYALYPIAANTAPKIGLRPRRLAMPALVAAINYSGAQNDATSVKLVLIWTDNALDPNIHIKPGRTRY